MPWPKGRTKPGTMNGKKHSLETRIKMREAQLGSKNHFFGKSHTEITKEKISKTKVMQTGGRSSVNARIRASMKYKNWRKSVFERDNYTCQECKQYSGVLNADHINPFALFPEMRFDIDNGRTLCLDCHKKTETYQIRFDLIVIKE